MTLSAKKKERLLQLLSDPQFAREQLELIESKKDDPLRHSELAYWLRLDAWTVNEGLLVLSGVAPGSVEDDGHAWLMHLCGEWSNASPFVYPDFSLLPAPPGLTLKDHHNDEASYQAYLENQEFRSEVLGRLRSIYMALRHRMDHSLNALGDPVERSNGVPMYPPIRFLAWARSISFVPSWLEWADKNGLLPDALVASAPPFFDADSPDYPELLVIAVRAWDQARKQDGPLTPKQRIEKYLQERYPQLADSTRGAIALVANWQKLGGRPRKE